jgi:hypothetical protein
VLYLLQDQIWCDLGVDQTAFAQSGLQLMSCRSNSLPETDISSQGFLRKSEGKGRKGQAGRDRKERASKNGQGRTDGKNGQVGTDRQELAGMNG